MNSLNLCSVRSCIIYAISILHFQRLMLLTGMIHDWLVDKDSWITFQQWINRTAIGDTSWYDMDVQYCGHQLHANRRFRTHYILLVEISLSIVRYSILASLTDCFWVFSFSSSLSTRQTVHAPMVAGERWQVCKFKQVRLFWSKKFDSVAKLFLATTSAGQWCSKAGNVQVCSSQTADQSSRVSTTKIGELLLTGGLALEGALTWCVGVELFFKVAI